MTLRTDGAVAAYWDLNNRSRLRIKHLGPAFFTKFLYFADAAGRGSASSALILDKVVAGRVNALIGADRLNVGGWSTRDYAFNLALADRVVEELNTRDRTDQWTPDAVEYGLFTKS